MLNFIKLSLNDIRKIKPYFLFSTNKTCDNTVGGTFMWRDYFSVEYAEYNETLVFKVKLQYYNAITAFTLPLGKDVYGCIKEIEKYCYIHEIPIAFCTVTKEEIPYITSIFNNNQLHYENDWNDYIYKSDDLKTLTGTKYKSQRNHINYFQKTYNTYLFEEITEKNINEVKEFNNSLYSNVTKNSDIFVEEQKKTVEVLDNYCIYGLIGGILRLNGSIVAFSIGEICNDVLFIHIEKADIKYKGVYQMINYEFANHFASDKIKYINREEDVGDEGLRFSKQSYHPCDIIKKYIILRQVTF